MVVDKFDWCGLAQVVTALVLTKRLRQHDQSITFPIAQRVRLIVDENDLSFIEDGLHLHAARRHEDVLVLTAGQHQSATIVQGCRKAQPLTCNLIRANKRLTHAPYLCG
jgi:hypothetical protein